LDFYFLITALLLVEVLAMAFKLFALLLIVGPLVCGVCYYFDRLLWGQRWFAGPLVIVGVGIGFNWFTWV